MMMMMMMMVMMILSLKSQVQGAPSEMLAEHQRHGHGHGRDREVLEVAEHQATNAHPVQSRRPIQRPPLLPSRELQDPRGRGQRRQAVHRHRALSICFCKKNATEPCVDGSAFGNTTIVCNRPVRPHRWIVADHIGNSE